MRARAKLRSGRPREAGRQLPFAIDLDLTPETLALSRVNTALLRSILFKYHYLHWLPRQRILYYGSDYYRLGRVD